MFRVPVKLSSIDCICVTLSIITDNSLIRPLVGENKQKLVCNSLTIAVYGARHWVGGLKKALFFLCLHYSLKQKCVISVEQLD